MKNPKPLSHNIFINYFALSKNMGHWVALSYFLRWKIFISWAQGCKNEYSNNKQIK